MLTAKDIKNLVESFATRYDLEKFPTKDDLNELKESFEGMRQDVMTKMDNVHKEVLDMRTEQSMHIADHDRIKERFERIEEIPIIARALSK